MSVALIAFLARPCENETTATDLKLVWFGMSIVKGEKHTSQRLTFTTFD